MLPIGSINDNGFFRIEIVGVDKDDYLLKMTVGPRNVIYKVGEIFTSKVSRNNQMFQGENWETPSHSTEVFY